MITQLFDQYRVFYEQESDIDRARAFTRVRLQEGDSVIFLAVVEEDVAGFVQMYPTFSSVSTARVWILNDLFVAQKARRCGVGRALLEHAADWARRNGALRLRLETAVDNLPAKALYESLDWEKEEAFDRYKLSLE